MRNPSSKSGTDMKTEIKLITYGHIIWLINFGVMRSLTIAFPVFKQHFGGSNSIVGLFTTCIMLGNAFGPSLQCVCTDYG